MAITLGLVTAHAQNKENYIPVFFFAKECYKIIFFFNGLWSGPKVLPMEYPTTIWRDKINVYLNNKKTNFSVVHSLGFFDCFID